MRDRLKVNIYLFFTLLIISLLHPIIPLILTTIILILILIVSAMKVVAFLTSGRQLPSCKESNKKFFVTVVIACANEPFDLLSKTLQRLKNLDYDHYEILVVDNNNTNEQNWKMIEGECNKLGEKFRFVHIDTVEGYKAGALNFALQYINQKTEILAIIDSDYLVAKNFLRDMTKHFNDPAVGIVQAPQDYYNANINNGLYLNFRSFFSVFMNQAQAFDTVTFTGTMGMIRKKLFDEKYLKWNEWCITEDTEAGIYIHEIGYKGVYLDESFGKGLMPLSYNSLIKQRSRWSYGNMQIILKDAVSIIQNVRFNFKQKLGFFTQLTAWIHFELLAVLLVAVSLANNLIYNNPISIIALKIAIIGLLLSLVTQLFFFILGLKETTLINKIKAFIAHSGLLFTMSYSWLYFVFGGKLGFLITDKKKQIGVKNYELFYELVIPFIFLLMTILIGSITHFNFLWLSPLLLISLTSLAGFTYLTDNFRKIT